MDKYKARQEAERPNMAKLRAQRLAAEAKATGEPKAKRKPGGKASGGHRPGVGSTCCR
jgi:hypothetical protein